MSVTCKSLMVMSFSNYYLGAPIWSHKGWVGSLFRRDAKASDYLSQYASVFNTVEGNTTFYAVPPAVTVQRWLELTPEDFQFCFKFPRTITHDKHLQNAEAETVEFLERMAPLGPRLGPFLLQLPPSFGPLAIPVLLSYLDQLPDRYRYAVEVRNFLFFAEGNAQQELNAVLAERGVDRVIFDTRALRSADPNEKAVRVHQQRKPDLLVHFLATASRPFFRYVGHPRLEANLPYLQELADWTARWIGEGRTPYVFMHSVYDDLVPEQARLFHYLMGQRLDAGDMPPWPGETEEPELEQLSLF